jgi:tricorn protease
MPSGYYRFPTIHADTIVFVCEDDLWTVSASGGVPRRLTSNLGEVTRPALSPDGTQLAFVGRDEGQAEIYLMPAPGGPARRLTYLGGSLCQTAGWTPDGKIVFANNAEHWYLRFTYLYTISGPGHLPERLQVGLARSIAYGPQGGLVLGRHTDEPARWKRYRGGTAGRLWIDPDGNGQFAPLIDLQGNLTSPLWLHTPADGPLGRIYFISDHEGVGNLYSCLPAGTDLRRHTDQAEFYVRNAASDGQRIVYHTGADLYILDPASGENRQISIEWRSPQTQRNRKFTSGDRYLESFDLHPAGHALALAARGKIFTFASWEGAVVEPGRGSADRPTGVADSSIHPGVEPLTGIRMRLPHWLPDGERLVAVSDEGGEECFVVLNANGQGAPERLTGLDIGRPEAVAVSPRQAQIVFSNHRYELLFLDLERRDLRLIDRGKTRPCAGFNWSPDGRWVAYSVSQSLQMMVLKLWQVDSGVSTLLAEPVLRDVAPAFDPQGRFIYFLSHRHFDPVRDNQHFDLSFPRGVKPYLITLRQEFESPFIPKPRAPETRKEENAKAAAAAGSGASEAPASGDSEHSQAKPVAEPEPKASGSEGAEEQGIRIDLEGITGRVVVFPVQEGRYGRILGTKDGKVLYTRYPVEGTLGQDDLSFEPQANGTLLSYNFEDQKEETVLFGVSDFAVTPDGAVLIYRSGNRLRVLKAGEKPDEKSNSGANRRSGWLDLGRVKVSVLPGAEWRQMFREAWRLQRDQFWTPDMSQVDWLAVYDRYLPLVDRVSSRSEFSDLMWEMQGELGTSHAYEFGGDYRSAPLYAQGFLGADFSYQAATDSWLITQIWRGDAWEPQADSPLNAPGINVKAGDRLLAINGHRLSQDYPPGAALINQAGQEVCLLILPQATEGLDPTSRQVTVKALHSETLLRYRQWVENNRRIVHAATDGRIGYLHIPDMGMWGYAEFHRAFLAEIDRLGLIIDERFNRGGFVSQLILEKLARRRLGYDTSRWGQLPTPYPAESVAGPMVTLANEYAGSDGDIFAHGFKLLKLGPVIGMRTWGGVIGIEPRHALVDGTITTQPEYSFWFNDVGWGVENYGTDPDIEVDIAPQDYAAGADPQLQRGIDEILRLLEAHPPQLPEFNNRPSRARPRLPDR